MQTKSKESFFLSKELNDIIDLDSLQVKETLNNKIYIEFNNKEKFNILKYAECMHFYKVTILIDEKVLTELITKSIAYFYVCCKDAYLKKINIEKKLYKLKFNNITDNIYKVSLKINKSKEGKHGI